jgi:hypothetical protein
VPPVIRHHVTRVLLAASLGVALPAAAAAQDVLLEGVPQRIRSRCAPLRSSLPHGTVAAIQCDPNTTIVRDMAYYLMEADDASNLFEQKMNEHDVKSANQVGGTCWDGKKSRAYAVGFGSQESGCYKDSGGRANQRYLEVATNCKKLRVDGGRLEAPALYIALQGSNCDYARLANWSQKNAKEGQMTSLTQPISRPNAAKSPACP